MGDNAATTATTAATGLKQQDETFPLTDVDRLILSMTDEEYKKQDWDELREIIATNNLSVLKRKPSDLRRYIAWTTATKAEYGSITTFLLANRLPKAWGSPPFAPVSQVPFSHPSDYCVLVNDWPYGLADDITHIVVWSRTLIPTEPETGDMTGQSRELVDGFVRRYFVERLEREGLGGGDDVLWFKNWVALQSVRSLEHVHVMVRGVSKEIVEEWTVEHPWHRLAN